MKRIEKIKKLMNGKGDFIFAIGEESKERGAYYLHLMIKDGSVTKTSYPQEDGTTITMCCEGASVYEKYCRTIPEVEESLGEVIDILESETWHKFLAGEPTCNDLISRQAVEDMLNEIGGCDASEEWAKGYDDAISNAIKLLQDIPAATRGSGWVTDHKPEQAGDYLVTLERPLGTWSEDNKTFTPDGGYERWSDFRHFAEPLEKPLPEYTSWVMTGEDPMKMHWEEQTGSLYGERVVAWADDTLEVFRGNLTDGVKYTFVTCPWEKDEDAAANA